MYCNCETLSNLHGLSLFQTSADILLVSILFKLLSVPTAAAYCCAQWFCLLADGEVVALY